MSVNGLPITNEMLLPAIALASEGELFLEVLREGADSPLELAVALAGRPIQLGLSWRADEAEPGAVFVTRVVPQSPADRAGIKLHDRIYALDGNPVLGQEDLFRQVKALLAENTPAIRFQIESRGLVREVPVSLRLPTETATDPTL